MDETELQLKDLIIKKYGSIKKFCEIIDMPWTTLDSILKRGVANSNITNIMKITKELKIDTECLANGSITPSTSDTTINIHNVQTKQEQNLLSYFNKLNNAGKTEATKRVEELTYFPRYAATVMEQNSEAVLLNAAHERTDIEVTDEMKKQDDDIMDDPDF